MCVFFIGDQSFDIRETGFFEHGGELAFGEAEPAVGVEFAGLGECVLEKIENDDAAARSEHLIGGIDGALWVFCVVEGLAEDGEVDAALINGRALDIADAEFEVVQAVFVGERLSVFDHFR